MNTLRGMLAGVLTLAALSVSPAQAQDSGNLAQQAQNPIANLISVPFQNNTNFNVGPFDKERTFSISNRSSRSS